MNNTLNRRHRDFLLICISILRSSRKHLRPDELARQALEQKAHGYYIDEDYAYRTVLDHLNYGKTPVRATTKEMFSEIIARIAELREKRADMSIMHALKLVLESGEASRFFMTARTARNLIERNYRLLLKSI